MQISWKQVYEYASALTPPAVMPANPESRINISPSRQLRKSEPDSMVWETLPVIQHQAGLTGPALQPRGPDQNCAHHLTVNQPDPDQTTTAKNGIDQPGEAIWPFIPAYSEGKLPLNKEGRLISTANARLRNEGTPFAPTFMGSWGAQWRVVIVVSWFYEFDSRVKPQIPYAVFPLDAPCWLMAGLGRKTTMADGSSKLTVAVITVDPNEVLQSVGHHRSPALLRNGDEAKTWLSGSREEARSLLRPHRNEIMGVEAIPMGIKIPGNERVELPPTLATWGEQV